MCSHAVFLTIVKYLKFVMINMVDRGDFQNLSEHFDENPRSAPVSFLKTCVYKLLNLFSFLFSFNLVQYLTALQQSLKAKEKFDIFLQIRRLTQLNVFKRFFNYQYQYVFLNRAGNSGGGYIKLIPRKGRGPDHSPPSLFISLCLISSFL